MQHTRSTESWHRFVRRIYATQRPGGERGVRQWHPAIATTAHRSVGELARDNATGFTYASGDVPALTEHLRRLVADPALRGRVARATEHPISRWGLEECADSFARGMIQIASVGS